jgi:hypothetical protein
MCFVVALLSVVTIMNIDLALVVFMPLILEFDQFSKDMHEG